MSELYRIELPGGGVALARTRLRHHRAQAIERTQLRAMTSPVVGRYLEAETAKARGEEPSGDPLTPEDIIAAIESQRPYQRAVIENVCARWSGVYDPEDEERELHWPDDLDDMDPADYDALYAGCERALAEGRANPRMTAGTAFFSTSSPAVADSPTTLPTASETPS